MFKQETANIVLPIFAYRANLCKLFFVCAQNLLLSCIYIYRCSMVQLCSRLTTAHKMALLLLLLVLPLAALAGDIGQELKDLGRYINQLSNHALF